MRTLGGPAGALRGTSVVEGEGVRFDVVSRLYRRLGYFGPGCTRGGLLRNLEQSGFEVKSFELFGAIALFEARRRENG